MGRLDEDDGDFDNIFEKADEAGIQDKKSAGFVDSFPQKSSEKIVVGDNGSATFGKNGSGRVEKYQVEGGGEDGDSSKYKTFKQNAKYNKYAGKEISLPKQEVNRGPDKRTKEILKDDDLGEVGEWAGVTLNKNAKRKDSEDDDDDGEVNRKRNDDDDFDFDNFKPGKPAVVEAAGGGTTKAANEDIQKKIQDKLNGKMIMLGTGNGNGISNRLANKHKELSENKEVGSLRSSTGNKDSDTRPTTGQSLESGGGVKAREPELSFSENNNVEKKPLKSQQLVVQPRNNNFPQDDDEDEWNEVNKQTKKEVGSLQEGKIAIRG